MRDLAFGLALDGNVQLIKALLDYAQPNPEEDLPSVERIEIIVQELGAPPQPFLIN